MFSSSGISLTRKWFWSREIGLMGARWSTSTTSWLWRWVLVRGRWSRHDCGFFDDLLKLAWTGKEVKDKGDEDSGSNSPRWHWPQKAVAAQAATAASSGALRSSLSTSCESILALIGGRGGCLEVPGARLWTPLKTYRSHELPFHSMLWVICHAFRAESRLREVLPACFPKLEAANAHRTNSSAGKRRCSGTCSESQKRMNCLIVPEYRLSVVSAQLLWMAWLIWRVACEERKLVSLLRFTTCCRFGATFSGSRTNTILQPAF